ncbi:hypothetical protein NC651_021594 [Populus alba x Populus x berolinensis]|nr:hypothetical protein NC651_021594 [Populus alba x Populus x berolinensis]
MELLFLDISVYITAEKRTQKGSNQLQVCNTAGSSLRPMILPRFTPCRNRTSGFPVGSLSPQGHYE